MNNTIKLDGLENKSHICGVITNRLNESFLLLQLPFKIKPVPGCCLPPFLSRFGLRSFRRKATVVMSKPIICGIYKITSPSGKIYIGQAVNIYKRWRRYRLYKCESQPSLYNSLKKYGWEKHKFEILCECKREQLNEFEKYYVDLFQTFNSKFGMNLTDGGGSTGKHSDETIKKQSESHKGIFPSDETRKKLSESNKGEKNGFFGKKHSDETKKKISESKMGSVGYWTGKKFSNETRKKLSESHKGQKHSDEWRRKQSILKSGEKNPFFGKTHSDEVRKKMSENKKGKDTSKRVLNTETGIYYDSIKAAAESIQILAVTLSLHLRNGRKDKTPFIYA